jgi:hypothetical protein
MRGGGADGSPEPTVSPSAAPAPAEPASTFFDTAAQTASSESSTTTSLASPPADPATSSSAAPPADPSSAATTSSSTSAAAPPSSELALDEHSVQTPKRRRKQDRTNRPKQDRTNRVDNRVRTNRVKSRVDIRASSDRSPGYHALNNAHGQGRRALVAETAALPLEVSY